jgi:hypothetical protein
VACEAVKGLPDQNGDEDWSTLTSMLKRLKSINIKVPQLLRSLAPQLSENLVESPLYEILSQDKHEIEPPILHLCTDDESLVQVPFTTREFRNACKQAQSQWKCQSGTPRQVVGEASKI